MSNEVKISEFKGNKVIEIPLDSEGNYKFSFGMNKAKAILTYLEDIKNFVNGEEEVKDE